MIENAAYVDMDPRRRARFLYWTGWRVCEIARELALNEKTVHAWKARDGWDDAGNVERIGGALEARLVQLILKEGKSGGDFKEIDLLHRQLERQARIQRYQGGGNEADLNPAVANRNAGPKKPPKKNAFSDDEIERLKDAFLDASFEYQRAWYREKNQRTRVILKSRQIGATFYFAREALVDALETGHNKIFLSASKNQSFIFKNYMQDFVRQVLDRELRANDDLIKLDNGAEIRFVSTSSRTAQGYHGDFYFDEFFWVPRFGELNKLASAMATHKHWRKTYFSTPSTLAHEACPFWDGTRLNKGRTAAQQIEIDVSHKALASGRLCEDRIWRQIVTIEDAERAGCTLFDIEELRLEYSAEDFANLFLCKFIDDSASVFPLAMLQPCQVDALVDWAGDFKPFAVRPYGDRPVWVGYDPAETGDSAGLVVVAAPTTPGEPFRVLERHQFRGMDFAAQAEAIRKVTDRYWVTYIGIDATGMGSGVAQLVRQFFPAVTAMQYSVELKNALVLKAYDVIKNRRLQYDAGWTDLTQALLAIQKTVTASGRQVTYTAGRNRITGHADLAWALMHALHNEPLESQAGRSGSMMEIL